MLLPDEKESLTQAKRLWWRRLMGPLLGSFVVYVTLVFASLYFEPSVGLWTALGRLALISLIYVTWLWLFFRRHLREYLQLVRKAFRMGQKFSQWVHEPEEKEPFDHYYFFESMAQSLDQVKNKLLISRRRLAHEFEQAKALMSSLQEAVVDVDLEGRGLFFNGPFAVTFLESTQVEPFTKKQLLLSHIFQDEALMRALMDDVIKHHQVSQLELKLPNRLTGTSREFLVRVSPLFEEKKGDDIYGALLIFHDVTELKQAQQNKLQFIENASHELRTPLTSLKGYLSVALMDLSPQHPVYALLKKAEEGALRLVELVNDLLDLATLDKSPSVRWEWFEAKRLEDRVNSVLGPLAQEKQMTLVFQYSPSALELYLDERKMEQILINLVSNAIRYNPGGTRVEIVFQSRDDRYQISVCDNGVGIPEEHWDRLFDRFYRIDKGRARDQGGTGLGLAIVKQLVELQQGQIRLQKPKGEQGICFCMTFPHKKA